MSEKTNGNTPVVVKKYSKIGIIAAIVIAVAAIGAFIIVRANRPVSVNDAISGISSDAVTGADLRIAVVRMDAIQNEAKVLQDLRKQRENYENNLRKELTSQQKALEKEEQ